MLRERTTDDDVAFDDFRTELDRCTREAVCGRKYVLVKDFKKWLRDKAGPDTRITQAGRLLMAAYRNTSQPGFFPVTSEQISTGPDCSLLVFSILLELDEGHLIHQFWKNDLVDHRLPILRYPLQSELSERMHLPNAKDLAARFDEVQWRYCPAQFELDASKDHYEKKIIPICQKRLINKGGTAEVWEITVQEQFVGVKIQDMLKTQNSTTRKMNLAM